ncbi:hypothetical protein [Corynebacterium mastitidis]|nr:hypothetical protein [Corynebacterium mastitidis]
MSSNNYLTTAERYASEAKDKAQKGQRDEALVKIAEAFEQTIKAIKRL